MRICLAFLSVVVLLPVGSISVLADESAKKTTGSAAEEEQKESKGVFDEYSDADLQHIIDEVQAQDAFGTPGVSGTMSSVVKSINSFSATHQEIKSTTNPATHSIESLRAGLLRLRESISSLHIAYVKKRVFADANEETIITHNQYAFKGPLQYVMYSDVLPDRSTRNHDFYVFDGKESRTYSRTQSSGSRVQRRGASTTQVPRSYLELIPVFAGPDATGHDPTNDIADILKQYKRVFEISPYLENVDGYSCHVVSCPLGFKMWIHAVGDACYLIRYVEFCMEGEKNSLVLNRIIAHRNFRKINNQFHWPFQTVMSYFNRIPTDSSLHSHWFLTKEYTVSEVELNNVSDTLFKLKFPPGTKIADHIRDKYYLIPEGPENLERAITTGATIRSDGTIPDWLQVENKKPIQIWEGTFRRNVMMLFKIIGLLFLLLTTYYFIHKRISVKR